MSLDLVWGLMLFILTYGVVAIQNDLADESIDKANDRDDIPLANGIVTIDQLSKLMLIMSFCATFVAIMMGPLVILWTGSYIFLGWVYSGPLNVKSRGILALFLLGICYGLSPWVLGAIVIKNYSDFVIVLCAIASFLFTTGIIALKDFKDETGDRAGGKNTALVKYGPDFVQAFIRWFTLIGYFFVIELALYSQNYILASIGLACLAYSWKLLGNCEIRTTGRIRMMIGNRVRFIFYGFCILTYILTK